MSQRCAPSERGFCSTVPYSAVVDPNVCRIRLQSRGQHAVCDSFSVGSVGWAGWLGWLAGLASCCCVLHAPLRPWRLLGSIQQQNSARKCKWT